MKRKAIFLDRDGVIIKMYYDRKHGIVETPLSIKQVEFVPGIFELLKYAKNSGYLLIIISNQPGVGIKKISENNFNSIKNYIVKTLKKRGVPIDAQYYCMHHPFASISRFKKSCECRKPKAGLIFRAAREHDIALNQSWLIGDGVNDIIAGHIAGCKTVLLGNIIELEYLRIIEKQLNGIKPNFMVKNLFESIELLKNQN